MLDEGRQKAQCLDKMKKAFVERRTGVTPSVLAWTAADEPALVTPRGDGKCMSDLGLASPKTPSHKRARQATLDSYVKKQKLDAPH